jgi:hypothetical protein
MECLFHLRRFVELRVFGAAHGDRLAAGEEVTRELAGALRLWSAQDARAEDALPADAQ